jgi:hypothetical protein
MTLVSLLTVCFLQPFILAKTLDDPDRSIIVAHSAPVGLARGQSLRITGLNPHEPGLPGPDGRKYKMLVAVLILDGSVAAQSDEFVIEPGEFHSFDFDREDLHVAGEPDTGRVQVCARIRYRFFSLVDRTHLPPASLELVDLSTGRTTAATSHKPKEIVVVGSSPADPHIFTADIRSTGMVHGQALRFSLLNSNDPSQTARNVPVRVVLTLFDAQGLQIAQSPSVAIPAGEFRWIDFNRDDLALAGEPGTGRVQVNGNWTMSVQDAVAQFGEFPAALEIIDTATGVSAGGFTTIMRVVRNANAN